MTDTAVHRAENIFPGEMVRQWVCSLPWKLRRIGIVNDLPNLIRANINSCYSRCTLILCFLTAFFAGGMEL